MGIYKNTQQFLKTLEWKYAKGTAYQFQTKDEMREVTYEEFVGKADGIAAYFEYKGIQRTAVALIGKTSYEWMATYFGVVNSNNIVVSMDARISQEEKEKILNQVKARYVFVDSFFMEQAEQLLEHCESVIEVKDMQLFVQEMEVILGYSYQSVLKEKEIAQYIYTSGTTGQSKAVMWSHENVSTQLGQEKLEFFDSDDIELSVLPVHHCFELCTGQLTALGYGITICLNDSLENLNENICRYRPTIICGVPLIAEELNRTYKRWLKRNGIQLENGKLALEDRIAFEKEFGGTLRKLYCGGAIVRQQLIEDLRVFGIKVLIGYGMTEMCGQITTNLEAEKHVGSVGIPFRDDIVIRIADDGEVLLKGPNRMMGYYGIKESDYYTDDGYLKTGDMGTVDEDGYLHLTGRKKNMLLLSNGENLYPEELESELALIAGVKQVVVMDWNKQVAAMIYPEETADKNNIEECIRQMNLKLMEYKRITKVFYREQPFPTTPSGKIKRNEFLNQFHKVEKVEFVAPATEEEKKLVQIIEDVFNLEEPIGVLEHFFSLGGNSLLALQVASKANINAQLIYEHPIIQDLAKLLRKEESHRKEEYYINDKIKENQKVENTKEMKCVLLTGATGFLGAHILYELITKGIERIICLVRSREKLEKTYRSYFNEPLPEQVEVVVGDIAKPYFGMEDGVYSSIKRDIDSLIHAAAKVVHIGEKESLMKTNYQATEYAIQMCKDANAVLHYISSYASSGISLVPIEQKNLVFDEDTLYIGQDYSQNVYVHSKYLSEYRIYEERSNDLLANVYRVGCLTSRVKDGMFQLNAADNGFRNRLRGLLKVGVYTGKMNQYMVDFTPVDQCAQAILTLAGSGKVNQVYHMFNPNTIHLGDLAHIVKNPLRQVSEEIFKEKIEEHLEDKEIAEYVFYNAMALSSTPVEMKMEKTIGELNTLFFQWREISGEYIQNFIG